MRLVAFGDLIGNGDPRAERWIDRVGEIGLDPRRTRHLRTTMAKRLADLRG